MLLLPSGYANGDHDPSSALATHFTDFSRHESPMSSLADKKKMFFNVKEIKVFFANHRGDWNSKLKDQNEWREKEQWPFCDNNFVLLIQRNYVDFTLIILIILN